MSMRYWSITAAACLSIVLGRDHCDAQQAIVVQGLVFAGGGKIGDFNWMITKPEFEDSIFIFNDNEDQYKAHRDHPMDASGCSQGGGNAVIRPFQCQSPPRAAGIPTGPNYNQLTPYAAQIIDEALSNICRTVLKQKYRRIFYSAQSERGELGTRIFDPSDDVKEYIVRKLRNLPNSCG